MRKLEKTDTNRSNNKKPFAIALEAKNSLEQTLFKLNTHLNGLTEEDARERLELYGVNQVAHEKAPPAFLQLLAAFNNPFIFVLIILASISFFTDYWLPLQEGGETDLIGVSIIVTMVLISGLLRFWQEYRTNKAAEALKSMVRTTATVLRRGHYGAKPTQQEIPINQLVPGDIILLSAGDMIPADLRLINSRDLFVSQAILTGEAIPVEKYDAMGCVSSKSVDAGAGSEGELLELSNICLMGTNVASGTAMGVVVATGGILTLVHWLNLLWGLARKQPLIVVLIASVGY